MSEETRSLWEIYDSEKELWRRGRSILLLIGLLCFILQALFIAAAVSVGNVDRVLIFGVMVALFWLQFYFVWIGVHWLRWLWGAWNLAAGFCLLIWAWRDSGMETLSGSASLIIGFYLCFSPSIYFFAKRQRETVRWKESLLFGLVCFLVLLTIGAGIIGLAGFRMQRARVVMYICR